MAKICDFGSSHSNCRICYRGLREKPRSLQWSSPEICDDGKHATAESDVWAFGCVALEASYVSGQIYQRSRPWIVIIPQVQFEKTPYTAHHNKAMKMIELGYPPATVEDLGRTPEIGGIDYSVWEVMQMCWARECGDRLSAKRVLDRLGVTLQDHIRTAPNSTTMSPQENGTQGGPLQPMRDTLVQWLKLRAEGWQRPAQPVDSQDEDSARDADTRRPSNFWARWRARRTSLPTGH